MIILLARSVKISMMIVGQMKIGVGMTLGLLEMTHMKGKKIFRIIDGIYAIAWFVFFILACTKADFVEAKWAYLLLCLFYIRDALTK
jgi:hypothetical protein